MNKADLIQSMAEAAGISKASSKRALNAFTAGITHTLKRGGRVSLVGFGSFSVLQRNAREGRNPRTGQNIRIPAKRVVKFKPGAELSAQVG